MGTCRQPDPLRCRLAGGVLCAVLAVVAAAAPAQVSRAPAGRSRSFGEVERGADRRLEQAQNHFNAGRRALQRGDRAAPRAAAEAAAAYDQARQEFEVALQLDPDLASAHGGLGASLVRLGRPTEAQRHYADGLRLAPADEELSAGWLLSALLQGRDGDAAHFLADLQGSHPRRAAGALRRIGEWRTLGDRLGFLPPADAERVEAWLAGRGR